MGLTHEAYAGAFAGAAQPLYAAVAGISVLALLAAWVLPTRTPAPATAQ
jgi:hypothetical protein